MRFRVIGYKIFIKHPNVHLKITCQAALLLHTTVLIPGIILMETRIIKKRYFVYLELLKNILDKNNLIQDVDKNSYLGIIILW